MKTAMQELIEQIDNQISLLDDNFVGGRNQLIIVKNNAISKLEKEKEQIIDAHFAGWGHAYDYYIIEADSYSSKPIQAEDYYNETYTQNK